MNLTQTIKVIPCETCFYIKGKALTCLNCRYMDNKLDLSKPSMHNSNEEFVYKERRANK